MQSLLKREAYSRADIISRRFCEKLYIFELMGARRIITSRAPQSQRFVGESPLDWLPEEERREVARYLVSYSQIPFLTVCDKGTLLFLPHLAPSNSLGAVMLFDMSAGDILRLADEIGVEISLADSLENKGVKRSVMRVALKKKLEDLGAVVSDISDCFGGLQDKKEIPRDLTHVLQKRINCLSYLVGCPVCLNMKTSVYNDYGDFDEGLFVAFTLVMLMLARRISVTRGADITLDFGERLGTVISVDIPIDKSVLDRGDDLWNEIFALKGIAKRKNMFFDCSVGDSAVYACIAPANKDWSILGLKHGDYFYWNS